MNRVGDMMLSVGLFAMIAIFGNLDYSTIFSASPYVNEVAITVVVLLLFIGATAKSAQVPLHVWLPGSMEGLFGVSNYLLLIFYIIIFYIYFSISVYLDISYDILYGLCPIISSIPSKTLYSITGNMLGDGNISLSKKTKGEGKYSMTMDTYSLNYLNHLNDDNYSQFTDTKFNSYPNINLPQHKGKEITQYHFYTKTHPVYTALHSL